MAQPLDALHGVDEILHRLGIGQVALLRGVAHQQVMEHQPCDQLGLAVRQAEAGAQIARDLSAQYRMVAFPALGDIVEQRRDIGDPAAGDLVDQPRGARVIVSEFALLDPRQQADRADGVFVHRVMVIHIELHLRVDAAEIGNEAAHHARLVHPPQHARRIVATAEQVEEQGVGAGIVADRVIDRLRIARRLAHGAGMDLQLLRLGQLEHLDQAHRVLAEPVVRRRRDPAAMDDIALQFARTAAKSGEEAALGAFLGEFLVQLGEEHARQAADPLGLQEIELHEPFDRALAGAIGEIHPFRDLALEIEGQPVLGAPRDLVEVAAHRQQEPFGPAEAPVFGLGQQADIDQLLRASDLMGVFPDPVERLKIAQSALAVLDIGLDDIAAVAHPFVPRVPLGQLLDHELPFGPSRHLAPEPARGLVVQGLVAPDVAGFEEAGADRQILARQAHRILDRTAGMPHFQAEIPHQIEHRLDHLLAPRGVALRGEEGDVDVRMGCHFRAPVTANRHDREPLRAAAIGGGVEIGGDVIVEHAHQLIDQEGMAARAGMAGGRPLAQPPGQLGTARIQCLF